MMETKSHRSGDFELIKYFSSEGPEYIDEGESQRPQRQEELYL